MTQREELAALKVLKRKILEAMNRATDEAELESFSFGEADGSQSVKRRSGESLMDWYDRVDKKIEQLERRAGGGVRTFSMNRYA